jgi:hypothetical protein
MGLKPRISRISIAPILRSGQLKNSLLPGFSPNKTVLRLDLLFSEKEYKVILAP